MDVPIGDHLASVWADPDIGEATFFIILEAPDGGPISQEPDVSMWVEPIDGRLDRVDYEAQRQSVKGRTQYEVRPLFDQRDMWNVGFRVEFAGRGAEELSAQVESTPPGLGPWGLLIYLFPFVLVGGVWVAAMVRIRRRRQEMSQQSVGVVIAG